MLIKAAKCRANFNSIKVRLKPPVAIREITDAKFQFHKGTIKTLLEQKYIPQLRAFQFHKGTIKTFCHNDIIYH